jgi:hypothetical protein
MELGEPVSAEAPTVEFSTKRQRHLFPTSSRCVLQDVEDSEALCCALPARLLLMPRLRERRQLCRPRLCP